MKFGLHGDYFCCVASIIFFLGRGHSIFSSILRDGGKACSINEPQEINIADHRLCILVWDYYNDKQNHISCFFELYIIEFRSLDV